MNKLDMYSKLPLGIKDSLKTAYGLIPIGWRIGKGFHEELNFLEKSQWWSASELEKYQNEQLQKLIEHAYKNVPYYKKMFSERGLTPGDIKTAQDLMKIPVLKKQDIRNNFELLKASNISKKNLEIVSTSGTTGKPLRMYYEKNREYLNNEPYTWRYYGIAGHRLGQMRATISNWTLPDGEYYHHNPVRNLLILSAYKLSENSVREYALVLQDYGIKYLDGFPSSLELFTNFLKNKNLSRPANLKAIFCYAEYISDWQRKTIEDYWGCKCFDRYSHEERAILGIECEQHAGLHLCSDFGITEFAKSEIDGYDKLIATSLNNYAMPLIRYDTEDIGRLLEKRCPCQRGFPLFELRGGRQKNFAVAKDYSFIPVANIDIPNVSENVSQFQFIQEERGSLNLRIIKKSSFADQDLIKIRAKLKEKFGNNMDIHIEFPKSLHKTDKNKTPLFIQKLKEVAPKG